MWVTECNLEAVLVDEVIGAWRTFLGLTEEHEVLKEEHSSVTLLTTLPDRELVLSQKITLFQQVHLTTYKPSSASSSLLARQNISTTCRVWFTINNRQQTRSTEVVMEFEKCDIAKSKIWNWKTEGHRLRARNTDDPVKATQQQKSIASETKRLFHVKCTVTRNSKYSPC